MERCLTYSVYGRVLIVVVAMMGEKKKQMLSITRNKMLFPEIFLVSTHYRQSS